VIIFLGNADNDIALLDSGIVRFLLSPCAMPHFKQDLNEVSPKWHGVDTIRASEVPMYYPASMVITPNNDSVAKFTTKPIVFFWRYIAEFWRTTFSMTIGDKSGRLAARYHESFLRAKQSGLAVPPATPSLWATITPSLNTLFNANP
jgi:hypothetical protein